MELTRTELKSVVREVIEESLQDIKDNPHTRDFLIELKTLKNKAAKIALDEHGIAYSKLLDEKKLNTLKSQIESVNLLLSAILTAEVK
jgi:hypothetical protein